MFGLSSKIYLEMSFQELHSVLATKRAVEFSYSKPSKLNALFNHSGLVTSLATRMTALLLLSQYFL